MVFLRRSRGRMGRRYRKRFGNRRRLGFRGRKSFRRRNTRRFKRRAIRASVVASEKKYRTATTVYNYASGPPSTWSTSLHQIYSVPQGSGNGERTGKRIRMKNFRFNVEIQPPFLTSVDTTHFIAPYQGAGNGGVAPGNTYPNVQSCVLLRFFIVLRKTADTASGTPFSMAPYLDDNTNWWMSFYNPDNIHNIRIIRDRTYIWHMQGKPVFKKSFRVRLRNLITNYDGSNATDQGWNSIFVVWGWKSYQGWGQDTSGTYEGQPPWSLRTWVSYRAWYTDA